MCPWRRARCRCYSTYWLDAASLVGSVLLQFFAWRCFCCKGEWTKGAKSQVAVSQTKGNVLLVSVFENSVCFLSFGKQTLCLQLGGQQSFLSSFGGVVFVSCAGQTNRQSTMWMTDEWSGVQWNSAALSVEGKTRMVLVGHVNNLPDWEGGGTATGRLCKEKGALY